jgi:Fe2+ transport system protein B
MVIVPFFQFSHFLKIQKFPADLKMDIKSMSIFSLAKKVLENRKTGIFSLSRKINKYIFNVYLSIYLSYLFIYLIYLFIYLIYLSYL